MVSKWDAVYVLEVIILWLEGWFLVSPEGAPSGPRRAPEVRWRDVSEWLGTVPGMFEREGLQSTVSHQYGGIRGCKVLSCIQTLSRHPYVIDV